ncbi:uncharacterized protein BXZ73DRAFT_81456 [Epithele typhae]|uniref:uncharacterized protein n=1 Tax=Epithele typhae TaxID=378194 RepID=UPI00200861B8|nr:uncharacterized protein BXZ73DRAFT_82325 [Epithele typhae]XP_047872770.1 uncharacterized protein BXZ73DRAFT_81456 [Epithele typhae]KAH9912490.1 hypothetical protein BXZ73DRAFT_82325 [Epithele typhae]KAH9915023.1 hypothetical protein BXZ73DRAFT_81456 [Epithele typhae]
MFVGFAPIAERLQIDPWNPIKAALDNMASYFRLATLPLESLKAFKDNAKVESIYIHHPTSDEDGPSGSTFLLQALAREGLDDPKFELTTCRTGSLSRSPAATARAIILPRSNSSDSVSPPQYWSWDIAADYYGDAGSRANWNCSSYHIYSWDIKDGVAHRSFKPPGRQSAGGIEHISILVKHVPQPERFVVDLKVVRFRPDELASQPTWPAEDFPPLPPSTISG